MSSPPKESAPPQRRAEGWRQPDRGKPRPFFGGRRGRCRAALPSPVRRTSCFRHDSTAPRPNARGGRNGRHPADPAGARRCPVRPAAGRLVGIDQHQLRRDDENPHRARRGRLRPRSRAAEHQQLPRQDLPARAGTDLEDDHRLGGLDSGQRAPDPRADAPHRDRRPATARRSAASSRTAGERTTRSRSTGRSSTTTCSAPAAAGRSYRPDRKGRRDREDRQDKTAREVRPARQDLEARRARRAIPAPRGAAPAAARRVRRATKATKATRAIKANPELLEQQVETVETAETDATRPNQPVVPCNAERIS